MKKYKLDPILSSLKSGAPLHYRVISPNGRFVEKYTDLRIAQNKVRKLNALRHKVWGRQS